MNYTAIIVFWLGPVIISLWCPNLFSAVSESINFVLEFYTSIFFFKFQICDFVFFFGFFLLQFYNFGVSFPPILKLWEFFFMHLFYFWQFSNFILHFQKVMNERGIYLIKIYYNINNSMNEHFYELIKIFNKSMNELIM